MRLTDTVIKKLENPDKDTLTGDDSTVGLYLRRSPKGKKSWLFRTRKGGSWHINNLGVWPGVSLAQARSKASSLSLTDLPDSMTFTQLLDEWFARVIEPRYKTTASTEGYISRGKQWFGSTQLSKLTTAMLVSRLKQYAAVSPVAANRCLAAWKLAFGYGVEIGAIQVNPLANTTSRSVGGPEKSRDRVLTDDEIRAMWASDEPLLRFLLLTGLRIGEAYSGRLESDRWVLDTSKNEKSHWVHLPPLALEQLREWDIGIDATEARLRRWCAREGTTPFVPHDLRRTFATRLAGLGVAPYVVEKCLNHTLGGVMAIYNRHTYEAERQEAAIRWADEVKRIVEGEA